MTMLEAHPAETPDRTALLEGMERLVSGLEPERLSGQDAARLVSWFSKMANLATTGRACCVRRAAEADVHLQAGFRSPAEWLARASGGSVGEAIGMLETAEAADASPRLDSAMRSGELSGAKARAVADAARVDPAAEAELLAAARHEDLKGLRRRCERVKARARTEADALASHEAIRARRYLRTWQERDGAVRGEFLLAPVEGALVLAALEVEREKAFDQARQAGEREPAAAYAADALVALARCGEGEGPRAQVLLRVDLAALRRGELEGEELCELAGIGPVPLAAARDLFGDAVLDVVLREGVDIKAVCSLGRSIPRAVRVALTDRDPTCAVPGCEATQHLELDHRVEFAKGGPTCLSNLVRLCRFHHRLKTYRGWRLEGEPGSWRWLAPPDRRPDPGGGLEPFEPEGLGDG